jgi:hypothetical protein
VYEIGSAVFPRAKLDRAEKAARRRMPHRPGDPRTRGVVLVPIGDDSTNVIQVLTFGRQRREVEPASDVRLMVPLDHRRCVLVAEESKVDDAVG